MKSARSDIKAFTLIELMLVVAILGICLTMGYPAISSALHRAPLTQAVVDITDGCRKARAHAILQDHPAELRIWGDGRIEVVDAPTDVDTSLTSGASPSGPVIAADDDTQPKAPSNFSAQLSDDVAVEFIAVNFMAADMQGTDNLARVRFYPNGTSDEFTVILLCNGERRKITLECVTALAEVEAL